MESNESEKTKKHETGTKEKENVENSCTIASNDVSDQENVISK